VNAPVGALPWPSKLSDKSARLQPVISDLAEVGTSSHLLSAIAPPVAGQIGWGHFYNGSLQSLNVGYADGHVDTHNRISIQWQFTGNLGNQSYFY
jgi:prepilin-type processing-associated H-X9-DG protein